METLTPREQMARARAKWLASGLPGAYGRPKRRRSWGLRRCCAFWYNRPNR